MKNKKGYLVKRVKITPIFANITHQLKIKTKLLIETKMPFFFSLQHLQLLLFYFIYRTTPHIFQKVPLIIFFYFIIFLWCTKRKAHLLFSFIYRTSPHFHHLLLFHYLPLMYKTKISYFLQKP